MRSTIRHVLVEAFRAGAAMLLILIRSTYCMFISAERCCDAGRRAMAASLCCWTTLPPFTGWTGWSSAALSAPQTHARLLQGMSSTGLFPKSTHRIAAVASSAVLPQAYGFLPRLGQSCSTSCHATALLMRMSCVPDELDQPYKACCSSRKEKQM